MFIIGQLQIFPLASDLAMIRKARPVFLEPRTTQPVYKQPKTELDGYLVSACAGPVDLEAIEDNPDLLNFRELHADSAFHNFLDQTYLDCQVNINHMKGEVEELRAKIRQTKNLRTCLQASDSRRVAPMSLIMSHSDTNYRVSACSDTSVTIVRCFNYSLASTKDSSG